MNTSGLFRFRGIGIVFIVLLLMAPGLMAQTSNRGLGTVEYLDGDVKINGVPADFGDSVGRGDWVQTGTGASVEIVFDRHNVFRLGSSTVAVIEIGAARQSVDLKFGSFSAVFDRLRTLTGRGTFDVNTTTVAAGVRGTSFFVRAVDLETTYVCICNGTLELDAEGEADPFTDSATNHHAYYFRGEEDNVDVDSAPMLYHTSETMDDLAETIGVTIPWSGESSY